MHQRGLRENRRPRCQAGTLAAGAARQSPQLAIASPIILVIVMLLTLLGWSIIISATRPWYAQRRHVEGGTGRLR